MKNWCKIITTDTHDILVKKNYDQEEDRYGLSLIIQNEDIEITQTLWYRKEDVRNILFEEMSEEDDLLSRLVNY